MQQSGSNKWPFHVGLTIAILAYVYVILRGFFVPPFCDEAITFFDYIRSVDFMPFQAKLDANNHVLNSAISSLFYKVFGGGIFTLRLANILAFGLYLFFLFRFRIFFRNQKLWLAFFVLLVAPQFFIDFFHLTRGYGLSMAFFLGAIYHLLQFNKRSTAKHLHFGSVLLSLAIWSNLSLTLTAGITGIMFFGIWIAKHRKRFTVSEHVSLSASFIFLFIAPFLYALAYGLELKEAGKLYYGADSDFWYYTVNRTMYFFTHNWEFTGALTVFLLTVLIGVSCWNLFKQRKFSTVIVHAIFWLSVLSIFILHHFQGVKFPVDRAVLHLFVLFIILLFLEFNNSKLSVLEFFGGLLAISCVALTASNLNLTHSRLWNLEHVPESYHTEILKWENEHNRSALVAFDGLHELVLDYHHLAENETGTILGRANYPSSLADFNVLKYDDTWAGQELYDTVFYNAQMKTGLLVRKKPVEWSFVYTEQKALLNGADNYFKLAAFATDSVYNKPVSVECVFSAKSPAILNDLQLIFEVKDIDGLSVSYKSISINRLYPNLTHGKELKASCLIDNIPENANEIQVFLWDVNGKGLTVEDAVTTLFAVN